MYASYPWRPISIWKVSSLRSMRFLNSLKKRVRSSSTDAGGKGGKSGSGSFHGSIQSGSNPEDSLHGSTWPSEAFPLYNIPSVSGTFSCDDRSMMSFDDDSSSVRSGSSLRSTGSASSRGSMVYYYDAKTGRTKLTRQDSYGRDRLDEMVNQSLTPRQLRERRRQKRREALQREAREKQKQKIRAAAQAAARRDSMSLYSGGSLSTGSGSGRSRARRRDSFSSISTSDSSRDVSSMNLEGGNSGHNRSLLGSWFSSSKSHSTATTVGTATEQSSSSNISSLGDWSSAFSADDMFSLDEALDENETGSNTDTANDENNSYYDGTNGYHDGETAGAAGEDTSVCTIGTNYSSSYYNGSNSVHSTPGHEMLGTTPPRSNKLKKFCQEENEEHLRGEDVEEHNYQRLQFQRYQEEDRRYQELQKQKQMQQPQYHHQEAKPDEEEEDFEQLQRRLQKQRDQYHQEREASAAPQQELYDHQEQLQWQQPQHQLHQVQNRYKPTLDAQDNDGITSRQRQQERRHRRGHPKCSNTHNCYELGAVYGKVKSGKALEQYVLQQLRLQQVQHQQRYGVNTTGIADECDEELHEKQRRLVKRWKNMHCRECRVKIGVPSSCFHELQRQQHGVGSRNDHDCSLTTQGGLVAVCSGTSAHRGKLPTSRKPVYVCLSCHYRAVCSSCWNRRVSNSK